MILPNEPTAAGDQTCSTTLAEIERRTKTYADARARLAHEVQSLNDSIEALKRGALPAIKKAVAVAACRETELKFCIETAPHLFEKPRTQIFHGIKVGFRKGTGGIDWEDDEKVVALIRKHFPKAQADLLIKTKEKPIAKALADLDVAELKRIGCTVEDTGDVVYVKPTDSEVDKVVNALLKDAVEQEGD